VSFVIHQIIHLNSPSFLICFSLASPSNVPSLEPSSQPSSQPSSEPSSQPTSSHTCDVIVDNVTYLNHHCPHTAE
jgi:hypothetical protein